MQFEYISTKAVGGLWVSGDILCNKSIVCKLSHIPGVVQELDKGAGLAWGRKGSPGWQQWWQATGGRNGVPGQKPAAAGTLLVHGFCALIL